MKRMARWERRQHFMCAAGPNSLKLSPNCACPQTAMDRCLFLGIKMNFSEPPHGNSHGYRGRVMPDDA